MSEVIFDEDPVEQRSYGPSPSAHASAGRVSRWFIAAGVAKDEHGANIAMIVTAIMGIALAVIIFFFLTPKEGVSTPQERARNEASTPLPYQR